MSGGRLRAGWTTLQRLAWSLAVAAAGAWVIVAWAYRSSSRADDPPHYADLQEFKLLDQRGQPVTLKDLRGSVWVADFIYTSCQSACPRLTARMLSLQTFFGEQPAIAQAATPVRLVSFSVDPENDTPERLAAYAKTWHADERRWSFLTGPLDEVNRAVVDGMKIAFERNAPTSAYEIMHGERFVVVDARGALRGYFDADDDGLERLRRTVAKLLARGGA